MTLCREACETVTGFWLSDVDFPRSWVTIRKRSAQQVVILIWREKEKVLQVPSGAADTNSAIGSACRWRCSYWNESIFSCVAWGKKKETKKRRFIEWPNIFPSNAALLALFPRFTRLAFGRETTADGHTQQKVEKRTRKRSGSTFFTDHRNSWRFSYFKNKMYFQV